MAYDITGSISQTCDEKTVGTISGTLNYSCDEKTVGAISGTLTYDCVEKTVGTITVSGTTASFVFEAGEQVLLNRPRNNNFVYAGGTLIRTFGSNSDLAFVDGNGVVSLPPNP